MGEQEGDSEEQEMDEEQESDETGTSEDETRKNNMLKLDTNKDGKLSKEELFLGEDGDAPPHESELAFFDKHLPLVDKDGDGLINLEELVELEKAFESYEPPSDL